MTLHDLLSVSPILALGFGSLGAWLLTRRAVLSA